MAKKFTEELSKLNTPDIRSVLRFLNNAAPKKLVKPTELASMRHDKCLKAIEDKFNTSDIEKALESLKAPGKKAPSKKADTTKAAPAVIDQPTNLTDSVEKALALAQTHLEEATRAYSKLPQFEANSYIVDMTDLLKAAKAPFTLDKPFIVMAAGPMGTCALDGPFATLEEARKEWPNSTPPSAKPAAKATDISDML